MGRSIKRNAIPREGQEPAAEGLQHDQSEDSETVLHDSVQRITSLLDRHIELSKKRGIGASYHKIHLQLGNDVIFAYEGIVEFEKLIGTIIAFTKSFGEAYKTSINEDSTKENLQHYQ